jgi:hypothetical protein
MASLLRYRFTPTRVNGRPVKSVVRYRFVFRRL